jgi:zinc transport system substrate-binding protein
MKRLFKYSAIILTLCLLLALLAGCDTPGSTNSTTRPDVKEKSLSVVATIFPAYDWARQIIGENEDHVALTLLLDKGTDLHNYQPTVEDIYKISTCDLFIYVGGESDKWVPDALAQATNKDMKVVCLLDALGSAAKEEEALEGMEDNEEEGEDEGPEYDEHVWLSLRNAEKLCIAIRDALNAIDPAADGVYWNNFKEYDEKLSHLEYAYSAAMETASRKTLLFADRFPFRYLADDYGLTCFAAFSGCSAETEASFETVNFLVNKVDELELPYIMVLEGGETRLGETIVENSAAKNARVLSLNSLQSVTAQGVEEGVTYLGVMESNLEVLKTALN